MSGPTTPAPPQPVPGRIEQLMLTPHRMLDHLANTLTVAGTTATVLVAATLLLAAVMRGVRRERLARDARQVVVLCPPAMNARAAQAFWSHLVGLLRPAWKRLLFGQPHLAFEYRVTGEGGITLSVWVPASVPPGLVERAAASAWPGARTRTLEHAPLPLPACAKGSRRIVAIGRLRLGRSESFPIRVDYDSVDIARDILTAATDLALGECVCVQILARPITGHRVRRALAGHHGGVLTTLARIGSSLAAEILDLFTPGSTTRSPRARQPVAQDRFSRMRDTTQARAAVTKTRGGHWETLIRYAAAVQLPADADRDQHRRARAVARGRAHAAAAVFASCTDLNFYHRRRVWWRPDAALTGRWLGRGDLLSVPELAGIAHLPGETVVVPGLPRAGARALAPDTAIPSGGPHSKPLGLADSGTGRPVALAVADARHHTHILGATGVGKSTLLAHWILADAEAGRGQVVIDPKGDLVTDILARLPKRLADKVVLFDADSTSRPPCINPLDTTLEGLDLAVESLATIFSRIYARWWGPRTDDLLRAGLRPFVRAAIAAGESTVDLAGVLDDGGICLARLPKGSLGDDTTRLMGSLLVARTWQAVTARSTTPTSQRADASLVLDEAQNFLNLSTPVEDMLAEARGLRLSLTLAHQNLGQLSRELREGISANARNKLIFSASPEDARDLARHTSPWLSEHDLTHLDVHHAAARVLVGGQQAPPFTFTTRPLPDPTPGRSAQIRRAAHTRTAPPEATSTTGDTAPERDPRLR